jgi:hypothetical protein
MNAAGIKNEKRIKRQLNKIKALEEELDARRTKVEAEKLEEYRAFGRMIEAVFGMMSPDEKAVLKKLDQWTAPLDAKSRQRVFSFLERLSLAKEAKNNESGTEKKSKTVKPKTKKPSAPGEATAEKKAETAVQQAAKKPEIQQEPSLSSVKNSEGQDRHGGTTVHPALPGAAYSPSAQR